MKVSVVIPVFNNEATVGAALESVFAQRFDRPFEVIVVNDGSTDGTGMELKKFRDRIRVIEQNRRGVAGARNVGINAAVGEYIALLDADDAWTDDSWRRRCRCSIKIRRASRCSRMPGMEEPGRFLLPNYVTAGYDHMPTLDELLNPASWPILPTTIVARRDMMIAIGGFPEQFAASDYGCEDTFAFLLMRERGEITFVSEKLAWYRMPNWERSLPSGSAGFVPTATGNSAAASKTHSSTSGAIRVFAAHARAIRRARARARRQSRLRRGAGAGDDGNEGDA